VGEWVSGICIMDAARLGLIAALKTDALFRKGLSEKRPKAKPKPLPKPPTKGRRKRSTSTAECRNIEKAAAAEAAEAAEAVEAVEREKKTAEQDELEHCLAAVHRVVECVRAARKRADPLPLEPLDDETVCKRARFTDQWALNDFAPFLWYVPRIVNVVSVCPLPSPSPFPLSPFPFSLVATPRPILPHPPSCGGPPEAAGGGRPGDHHDSRGRTRALLHASARPSRNFESVQRRVLRTPALCCSPARVCAAPFQSASLSYAMRCTRAHAKTQNEPPRPC